MVHNIIVTPAAILLSHTQEYGAQLEDPLRKSLLKMKNN